MQRIVKSAFIGLCISALFLMLSSSAARAQVLAGSGDVSGYGGYTMVGDGLGNHPIYGGAGGFNLVPAVSVFGEYSYISLGSNVCEAGAVHPAGVHPDDCVSSSMHTQLYGGGARFNFLTSTRVVPYAVAAFGGANISGGNGNAYYFGLGGGASCYIGHNWGVRPEYRYMRLESTGGNGGLNNSAITGAVFYQFGGHGSPRK